MKNKDLYAYHLQIEQLKTSILYHFMSGKIKEFYKHNAIRLNTMIEKITNMQNDFFVLDESGRVKQEGEPMQPVMKDGKTYDEYLKLYNELMEQNCPIKF